MILAKRVKSVIISALHRVVERQKIPLKLITFYLFSKTVCLLFAISFPFNQYFCRVQK